MSNKRYRLTLNVEGEKPLTQIREGYKEDVLLDYFQGIDLTYLMGKNIKISCEEIPEEKPMSAEESWELYFNKEYPPQSKGANTEGFRLDIRDAYKAGQKDQRLRDKPVFEKTRKLIGLILNIDPAVYDRGSKKLAVEICDLLKSHNIEG